MSKFQQILDDCAFQAFEKQMRLQLLLGEHEWLLDTEAATVTFNDSFVFAVQFLGTKSGITNSWLWADANEKAPFPDSSLKLCRKVRRIGSRLGIEEFKQESFPFLDEVGKPKSHTLAMVATCLAGASCFGHWPRVASQLDGGRG